jgi:uncharacterized tellurite resistance protein B-like protein
MLATIEEGAPGPKDAVVHRVVVLVADGRLVLRTALREAPKATLQGMCDVLELDDRGTVDVLVDRLDRAARFAPLGDADEAPSWVRHRLPADLDERESLFALELHGRLARRSRGSTALTLGEIIGRLGRHRAAFRARTEAARDAGLILWSIGVSSSPDLRDIMSSPGVEAQISLSLRPDWASAGDVSAAPPPSNLREATAPSGSAQENGPASPPGDDLAADIAALGMGVARADDVIHPDEEALVRAYARRRAASPAISMLLTNLKTQPLQLDAVAKRVAARLDAEQRRSLLEHLCDVALADGVLVADEVAMLHRLGSLLESPLPHLDDLARRFAPPPPWPTTGPQVTEPNSQIAESRSSDYQGSSRTDATPPDCESPGASRSSVSSNADQHVDEILSLLFD